LPPTVKNTAYFTGPIVDRAKTMNPLRILRLAAFILIFDPSSLFAGDINPPFGLHWGETEEHLERLLKATKVQIVQRRVVEGREAWDVEGLLQTGLKRTVFYFRKDELVEVELQYQKDDWDEAKYNAFMGDVRRRLEQTYGQGQLIARKKEQEPQGDITQTLVGWKWNQNNTAIELVYFSAANSTQVFRTLSVHYKAY
jgi:hypothetical protein